MTIRYTREHGYVRLDGDVATVGISDHAQHQMGDVTFVELPRLGAAVIKGRQAAVVESIKAASEIVAPVSGEIVEINAELEQTPGNVNDDPLGAGWLFRIAVKDRAELDDLMDEASYAAFAASQSGGGEPPP